MFKKIAALTLVLSLTGLTQAAGTACNKLNTVQRLVQQAARQRALQEAALRPKACAKILSYPKVVRQKPNFACERKTVAQIMKKSGCKKPNNTALMTLEYETLQNQIKNRKEALRIKHELEALEYPDPSTNKVLLPFEQDLTIGQLSKNLDEYFALTRRLETEKQDREQEEQECINVLRVKDELEALEYPTAENFLGTEKDLDIEAFTAHVKALADLEDAIKNQERLEQEFKAEQERQRRIEQDERFEEEKQKARLNEYMQKLARENQPSYWQRFKEALARIMYGNGDVIQ